MGQNQVVPAIGEDVSHLMGGQAPPAIGDDVSALMQPMFHTENAKDASGKAVVRDEDKAALLGMVGLRPAVFGMADPLTDMVKGAAKGAADTVSRIGDVVRYIPGVSRLDALMQPFQVNVTPTNPAQSVGKTAERIGEVALPSRAIASLGVKAAETLAPRLTPVVGEAAARMIPRAVVEGGAAAVQAGAQGGNPLAGGVMGAAAPVLGEATRTLAPGLRDAAEKKVVQALGPTKERFKAMAEKIAPQVLQRGLGGSRESLQAKAAEMVREVGGQIDDAIEQYGARQVNTKPVLDAIEESKAAFQRVRPMSLSEALKGGYAQLDDSGRAILKNGATIDGQTVMVPVVFDQRPIRQLSQLQKTIADLGDNATVEHLVAVRRAWDKVVAQAGGFSQRGAGAIGVPLKDQSEAWAKRQATTAIRKVLDADVPELAAVNKEFAFWKSLDDVLEQTLKRTQPQGPGLGGAVTEAAGAAMGSKGGLGIAFATAKLAKTANAVFTSPRWRLVDARLRNQLADAIATGNGAQMGNTLARIAAVESSRLPVTAEGR